MKHYANKSNAARAAKAAGLSNYTVAEHPEMQGRFVFKNLDELKAFQRDRSAHPVPTAWATFDASLELKTINAKTKRAAVKRFQAVRAAKVRELIGNGMNPCTARTQAYRYNKWLQGKWARPTTAPCA